MPPLCCRFQAAIAIHELSLTRSAAEVVFPAVQPTDDRCALDGLAAFEPSHQHLNALSDVRPGLSLHPAPRNVMLVLHVAPELAYFSAYPRLLAFPGQDSLRDGSARPP